MRPYRDSRLTYVFLSVFFVVVLGYAGFEARGIVLGPSISLSQLTPETTESFVIIQGHAERIASLSMNGREIAVTESGAFTEPYLLAPGYNRILIEAKDRYGRRRSAEVEMVYTPPSTQQQTPEKGVSEIESTPTTTPDSTSTLPVAD